MQLPQEATHVWLMTNSLPIEALDAMFGILDEQERQRARRYHFKRDRDRFVASRAAVREVLAGYLACAPDEVEFEFAGHGKPRVAAKFATSLHFNMSNSGDWTMLALAQGREVGVDIERINRQLADPDIVGHYFSPGEILQLQGLQDNEWLQGFFNCWTRKEAFIKATGEGLSRPLDSFEVSLAGNRPPTLLWVEGCSDPARCWQMTGLPDTPGYASALVVNGMVGELHSFRWSPVWQ